MILLIPLLVVTLATATPAPAGAGRGVRALAHAERPVSAGPRHALSGLPAHGPPLHSPP